MNKKYNMEKISTAKTLATRGWLKSRCLPTQVWNERIFHFFYLVIKRPRQGRQTPDSCGLDITAIIWSWGAWACHFYLPSFVFQGFRRTLEMTASHSHYPGDDYTTNGFKLVKDNDESDKLNRKLNSVCRNVRVSNQCVCVYNLYNKQVLLHLKTIFV